MEKESLAALFSYREARGTAKSMGLKRAPHPPSSVGHPLPKGEGCNFEFYPSPRGKSWDSDFFPLPRARAEILITSPLLWERAGILIYSPLPWGEGA